MNSNLEHEGELPDRRPVIDVRSPALNLDLALTAAEQIYQRINFLLSATIPNFGQDVFYTRSRVKTRQSIFEKEGRKRRQGKSSKQQFYSYRDMTDIVGVRVVTLYDVGLYGVQNLILALVEAGSAKPDPLFDNLNTARTFIEAEYYCRAQKDIYSRCRSELADKLQDKLAVPDPSEGQFNDDQAKAFLEKNLKLDSDLGNPYSSAHFIFVANAYVEEKIIKLPIEIQMRVSIEDVWAEINHKALYKLQSDPAWSGAFSTTLGRLEDRSESLKEGFDLMLKSMTKLGAAAAEAKQELAAFKIVPGDVFKSEGRMGLYYKSSFISYHFFQMGSSDFEDRFGGLFQEYAKHCEGLRIGSEISFRQAIKDCLGVLGQLADEISATENELFGDDSARRLRAIYKQIDEPPDDEFHEASSKELLNAELIRQRKFMVEFENLRLKALDFLVGPDGKVETNRHSLDESQYGGLEAVFTKFCELTELAAFKVKSMTVVYYWKYLMLAPIDRETALEFLSRAYEALETDPSLAERSIYRVLVPRSLSDENHESCHRIVTIFLPGTVPRESAFTKTRALPNNLRIRAYGHLEKAFAYSLEAWNAKMENGFDNGDLCFGFKEEDLFIDVQSCAKMRQYCNNFLDIKLFDQNQYFKENFSLLVPKNMSLIREYRKINPPQVTKNEDEI